MVPQDTSGWADLTATFWSSAEGTALTTFLEARRAQGAIIFPPEPLRALQLTPPDRVRVVVLGQDPYHGPGQAEGLAFSVAPGVKPPPSLRNIFQELQRDLGLPAPANGSLVRWAEQGVLLLNTCLTVEDGQPASHARRGWEALTDRIIERCSASGQPKAFLLWGAHAQKKADLIDAGRHRLFFANHPSPLSARRGALPFIGCSHFSQANAWLERQGARPIAW
jgi:uracil-DNA glycosylase